MASVAIHEPARRFDLSKSYARAGRLGMVLGGLGAVAALLMMIFNVGEWPDEKQELYQRYNDAMVAADLALAWELGCAADQAEVTLAEFRGLYAAAVEPLGARLDSWHRLRGGPLWEGPVRSLNAMPDIAKVDGHYCVHLGGSPLGEPF
jgi:hypothetical protein